MLLGRHAGYRGTGLGVQAASWPAPLRICTVEMHVMHMYEDLISTLSKNEKNPENNDLECLFSVLSACDLGDENLLFPKSVSDF